MKLELDHKYYLRFSDFVQYKLTNHFFRVRFKCISHHCTQRLFWSFSQKAEYSRFSLRSLTVRSVYERKSANVYSTKRLSPG